MMLPDVNVLIGAFRKDSLQHIVCKRWLDGIVADNAAFGISRLVLSAVVRITTGNAFASRSGLDEAFGFCRDLTGQPHCSLVEPGERHWDIFEKLCLESGTAGPRVTDAWFAALAIENGCEWITLDRDFARFPPLKWAVPGA